MDVRFMHKAQTKLKYNAQPMGLIGPEKESDSTPIGFSELEPPDNVDFPLELIAMN